MFVKDTISSGSYHVGGTLPMKIIPEKELPNVLNAFLNNMTR